MFYMLEILQDEIKKNVDALIISMKKEPVENSENATDDDMSSADDTLSMDNLLESAKNSFLEL